MLLPKNLFPPKKNIHEDAHRDDDAAVAALADDYDYSESTTFTKSKATTTTKCEVLCAYQCSKLLAINS